MWNFGSQSEGRTQKFFGKKKNVEETAERVNERELNKTA